MEKCFGIAERHDQLLLYNYGAVLIFGYGEEDGEGYAYRHTFSHIPSKGEVLDVIINHVNKQVDKKILSGFTWNGLNVWLSIENQFNFKAAYDVAVQTDGESLPVKFKLGEDEGIPQYYTFEDMATFANFYTSAVSFIIETLNDGWVEKDNARQWVDSLEI